MDRPATRSSGRRSLPVGASALLIVLLLIVLLLVACSAGSGEIHSAPPSTAETAAPGHADGARRLPAPLPEPADDEASRRSAVDLGTAAVTAFARPDLPPDQWWADLAPMLSPAATEAYVGTDPAQVPASAVTGPGWWGESPSNYLALVLVPTDAGEYAVLLVREGGGARWLVERISQVQAEDGEARRSPGDPS